MKWIRGYSVRYKVINMTEKIVTDFKDNGTMGSLKNLFANAMATMPNEDFLNIYDTLTPVLAKQFVHVPETPANPVTKAFIGEALTYGSVIEDIFIDPTVMGATKTRPTAEDEVAFVDSTMKKQYSTINAMNTGKISKYMYEMDKASLNAEVAGSLGDGIVESLRVGQVACLENQSAKVLVSSIPKKLNVYCGVTDADDGATVIKKEREKIIETAMGMSKVNADFTATGWQGGSAREILIFATKEKWAELILDKSGVFHPEYLMFDQFEKLGVKIIPVAVDKIETPVTEDEATEYETTSGIKWDDAPGLGQPKPDFIMCDKRYLRINPFIDRYKMFTKEVVSGTPYVNYFLHMQNAISYQPNRKAVRIYSGVKPVTATFVDSDDYDNAVIGEVDVQSGEVVVFTKVPEHTGKTFKAWTPTFTSGTTKITANTTYKAVYN